MNIIDLKNLHLFPGFLNSLLQYTFNTVLQKLAPQIYQKLMEADKTTASNYDSKSELLIPESKSVSAPNALLQNAQQMADVKFDFAVL